MIFKFFYVFYSIVVEIAKGDPSQFGGPWPGKVWEALILATKLTAQNRQQFIFYISLTNSTHG